LRRATACCAALAAVGLAWLAWLARPEGWQGTPPLSTAAADVPPESPLARSGAGCADALEAVVSALQGSVDGRTAGPTPGGEAAAPVAAATDAESDAEWRDFPRTAISVAQFVASPPGNIIARGCYRNRQLNPRDHYIPPQLREELRLLLDCIRPELERFHAASVQVHAASFREAAAQGLLRPVTGVTPRRRTIQDENGNPVEQSGVNLMGLKRAGIDNVEMVHADGSKGYGPEAPYDRIYYTAGAPDVPEAVRGQLKDGGIILGVVGPAYQTQRLIRYTKNVGRWDEEKLTYCIFVPLTGELGYR